MKCECPHAPEDHDPASHGGGCWGGRGTCSAGPSASTSMIEDAIIPAKTLGSDLAREIAMEIQAASQETKA